MNESLAMLVREFRGRARLSQEELAERSGLSARTVGDIETGFQRAPRAITLMQLAEALDLDENERSRLRAAVRARGAGTNAAPAPKRPLPTAPNLIGRESDVAALMDMLAHDDARLVTVLGPAGVGKTSLALRVAAEALPSFEGKVAVALLGSCADPSLVPAVVAAALDLGERAGRSIHETITEALARDRSLLVLDNFEHLMPAAGWIGNLVASCPALFVLVTSRERLHLRAERTYALAPLHRDDGVALFVERGRAVKHNFTADAAAAHVFDGIVERLEGLPLAIELAAARLTILSPQALLARLERRLPLLAGGPIDLPERQQTMRNAIAWSYDLLEEDERRMLRHVAVFNGGCTVEAARAVLEGDASGDHFLSKLGDLVEKNLFSLTEDDEGEPRIGMLELVREFGMECLIESEELASAQRRLATYFLGFAVAAEPELVGVRQATYLARLQQELANLRAALQWSLGEDLELGMRLSGALWRFWWMRGLLSEGRAWYDRFLDAMQSRGNVSQFAYAKVLQGKVALMGPIGDFEEALGYCERAVAIWRELGDEYALCVSLNSLGIITHMLGDHERARRAHEEALAIRRRIGDAFGVGTSLGSLAAIAEVQGDAEAAIAATRESVGIFRRLENGSALSIALVRLGFLLAEQDRLSEALELLEEALALQLELDDRANVCYTYRAMGEVAHKQGDLAVARAHFAQAFALLETLGNKSLTATVLEAFAYVLVDDAEARRAARAIGAAHALREYMKSPLLPQQRSRYDRYIALLREQLGDVAFTWEHQRGAEIGFEPRGSSI